MTRLLVLWMSWLLIFGVWFPLVADASEELGRQEDSASASGQVLMPIGGKRADTPTSSTDTDGDYTLAIFTAAGRLYTSTTIDAALPAGTNAIGKLSSNSGVVIGDVNIAGGSIGITSLTPGTTATNLGKAEGGTHANADTGVPAWGVRHDTSTTGLGADGTYAALGLDANGRLYTNADTELPAAIVPADNVANASYTVPYVAALLHCYNGTGANTWSRCPGGLSDTDDGTIAPAQVPYLMLNLPYAYDGTNWVRPRMDPCQDGNKLFVTISQTTSTQLFTGTASKRTYVCSFVVTQPSASTQTFSLVNGTGSVCGTSTGAMIGATTAASGNQLSYVAGNGLGSIAKSTVDAANVCLLQSSTDRLAGVISYVAAIN